MNVNQPKTLKWNEKSFLVNIKNVWKCQGIKWNKHVWNVGSQKSQKAGNVSAIEA